MNEVEKLYDKLMKINLEELLQACAISMTSKMDEKRKDLLFMALESRLQKRRMCIKLGIKEV